MSAAQIDSNDEWLELMGKDLLMRVIGSSASGADSLGDDYNDEPAAEVGDAIQLDFTGRRLLSFDGEGCCSEKELPFVEKRGCLIALGDGDVIPGLEMAARFLSIGQRAIVKCRSKYAYGAGGRRAAAAAAAAADTASNSTTGVTKDLPPNSDVVLDVCVRDIIPSRRLLEDDDLKIQLASSKKQLGNECYQYEWDDHGMGKGRALKLYGKARDSMMDLLSEIETRQEKDDAVELTGAKQKAASILIDCLNNISAVHLKAKAYGKAKESAATVLQYDPNNIKALCRAARAAIFDPNGTFEECEMAIAAAEEIDGENADVKRLRVELDRRKKQHKKREKAMYSKMMAGGGDVHVHEQQMQTPQQMDNKKPSAYLYLFASLFVTLGSLLLFELVARANNNDKEEGGGVDGSNSDQDL